MNQRRHILVLDNIRSTHNVGSLFRTADAAGISKIYLSGITPDPIDRFGRKRKDIAKASLGAEETVSWEHSNDTSSLLSQLKEEGYFIVAIEQSENSLDYKSIEITKDTVFVLGPEVEGMSTEVLSLCDVVAEIPMNGEKESLNVSVAGGIALFRILNI